MSVPNCKALSTTGHPPKGGNELTHTYYHYWRKALGQFPRLKYLSGAFWDLVIKVLNEAQTRGQKRSYLCQADFYPLCKKQGSI